jgi:glutaredoxin
MRGRGRWVGDGGLITFVVIVIAGALDERGWEHPMFWSWFKKRRPGKKLMACNVVLYTRQGCHLCEQAWQQLEQARQRYGFTLEQVDIDADPQLVCAYGECVPVVTIDGKVRFRGVVNRVLLERLLSR